MAREFELPEAADFLKMEEEVLAHWREIRAFEQQLERTKDRPLFTFYDGPPFATGAPHSGHVSLGTMKDVITRYASMNGFHCPRRFGWDCHGLPIEYEIDKALGIKDRQAVYAMGVAGYNAECRKIVMRCAPVWADVVERTGRWVEMDGAYRTMDPGYMEGVWWVFKQVFDKGCVYQGCRVMGYSPKISTVLSNFEASSNYKDRTDTAVFVAFPLLDEPDAALVAWTTTPWSLPSNLALAVHPELEYVKVRDAKSGKKYILARARLRELYRSAPLASAGVKVVRKLDRKKQAAKGKLAPAAEPRSAAAAPAQEAAAPVSEDAPADAAPEFEELESCLGRDLVGREYVPPYPFYHARMQPRGCFRVYAGEYVAADAGTGVVHTAPAYGEEDYEICLRNKLIEPHDACDALDADGKYVPLIAPFAGRYIFDCVADIVESLARAGRLVKKTSIVHSYPMCWRSDTPLIKRAVKSWFIRVSELRAQLTANNAQVHWVPPAMKKRFHEWVEKAEDWCFSRSRFWGNPIPLWVSADGEEVVCVGSVAELRRLAGLPAEHDLSDLHREHIDRIEIPSRRGKGALRRVEEVFDCWFESGAMPYASVGLPRETPLEQFARVFPAHFIGEGPDQIRGWFYTLNVLSALLFGQPPYRNVVVTGMILDRKGDKLSKSKRNYTDPMLLVAQKGADALRLYFMNSPMVHGEELRFKEEELDEVVKRNFIPWYNLCRLVNQEVARCAQRSAARFVFAEELFAEEGAQRFEDVADRWILAQLESLVAFVRGEFAAYRLYTVVAEKLRFLNELSNWYVKLSKPRLKGDEGEAEARLALNVLLHCVLRLMTLMAPFVPFLADYFYLNLRQHLRPDSPLRGDSIHFLAMPVCGRRLRNPELVDAFKVFQALVTSVRKSRERRRVNLKQPLRRVRLVPRTAAVRENLELLRDYFALETNVLEVEVSDPALHKDYVEFVLDPDHKALGEKFKARYNELKKFLLRPEPELTAQFVREGRVTLRIEFDGQSEEHVLDGELLALKTRLRPQQPREHVAVEGEADFAYELDFLIDEELKLKGLAREMVNRVQKLRKGLKLGLADPIYVVLRFPDAQSRLRRAYAAHRQLIAAAVKKPLVDAEELLARETLGREEFEVEGERFDVEITRRGYAWNAQRLAEAVGEEELAAFAAQAGEAMGPAEGFDAASAKGVEVPYKGRKVLLTPGEHFNLY